MNGRVAAPSRFISKYSNHCQKNFNILKGCKDYSGLKNTKQLSQKIKYYLGFPPFLMKPKLGDVLQLYMAASDKVVSMKQTKIESNEQKPIYYVSNLLWMHKLGIPRWRS